MTSPEPSPVISPRTTPRGSPVNSPRGVRKLIKRGKVSLSRVACSCIYKLCKCTQILFVGNVCSYYQRYILCTWYSLCTCLQTIICCRIFQKLRFKWISVGYTSSDCVARLGGVNMPVGIHGCACAMLSFLVLLNDVITVLECVCVCVCV